MTYYFPSWTNNSQVKKTAGTFTESEKNQHVRIAIDLFIVCSHKKSGAIKQKHASLMTKNFFSTESLKILPGKQDYVYKVLNAWYHKENLKQLIQLQLKTELSGLDLRSYLRGLNLGL